MILINLNENLRYIFTCISYLCNLISRSSIFLLYFIANTLGIPLAPTKLNPIHSHIYFGYANIEWSFNYESWRYGTPFDFNIYCWYRDEISPIKIANLAIKPFVYKRTFYVLPFSKCWCFIRAVNNFGQGQQSQNFTVINSLEIGNFKSLHNSISIILVNILKLPHNIPKFYPIFKIYLRAITKTELILKISNIWN